MKQSREAFWWSLFSAGGVLSALLMPALMVASGFVVPLRDQHEGRVAYDDILCVVSWWPVRIVLFGLFFLAFFHAAHRMRHIVMDLGWRHRTAPLSLLCYGGAVAGMVMAAWVLVGL